VSTFEVEKQKHEGYPILNSGKLDRAVCNYPLCGKSFKNRDDLFRHLKRMIEPERMINGYHIKHFAMKAVDPLSLTCAACGEVFADRGTIYKHYSERGVGEWSASAVDPNNNSLAATDISPKVSKEKQAKHPVDAIIDPYSNLDVCVVCMDKKREVVNVPCGHLICCSGCGALAKCPICRANIDSIVRVYYS